MKDQFNITKELSSAIDFFWKTKARQLKNSIDATGRGSVVGGKQMDGFLKLLRKACVAIGVPDKCIFDRQNYVPGFFRSSKDWDFMVVSPTGKLMVLIELKSQVGSYGNNFNNRTEEALGSATDLWTAYREKVFPSVGTPWVGFLMLMGYDNKSTEPVRNNINHYPVLPEFDNASYLERYRILCEKMMTERLYTCTALISTSGKGTYEDVSDEVSIKRFINRLQGHLIGCIDEFNC